MGEYFIVQNGMLPRVLFMSTETFFTLCTVEFLRQNISKKFRLFSVESYLLKTNLHSRTSLRKKTLQILWSNTLKVSTNRKAGNRHRSEAN